MEFDHCYQYIEKEQAYFDLETRGFKIASHAVEHPGAVRCRFVDLNSAVEGGRSNYLEFIFNFDRNALREENAKEGGATDEKTMLSPGFSLSAGGGLENFLKSLKGKFVDYKDHFVHRNYDWKNNSKEKLPGWNFLSFKKQFYPGIEVWLTEYEASEKGTKKTERTIHPNTCSKFLGHVWRGDPQGVGLLESLTEKKIDGSKLTLDDGLSIWLVDGNSPLAQDKFSEKEYPFFAVVLECTDFEV